MRIKYESAVYPVHSEIKRVGGNSWNSCYYAVAEIDQSIEVIATDEGVEISWSRWSFPIKPATLFTVSERIV